MKRIQLLLAMILSAGLISSSFAQDEKPVTLKVGDAAPALVGGKWIKGEPVDKFEDGKIYVVEFWATWCGPCKVAIPHVTEMQKTYGKDVTFIGQDVWENDQSAAEPFVQTMGDKMEYKVRMDDVSDGGRGKMAETWMAAAGQNGIPCSFLIGKDGKIAWIGHPMELEPVLKQVIAGSFDPGKATADKDATEQLGRDLEKAMEAKDYDKALGLLDQVAAKQPGAADQVKFARFNILLQKKDYEPAYKLAAELGTSMGDNAAALNAIAWALVDTEGLEKRDLPLAEKLATRAVELTERKDAAVLDTLARVHFEKGEKDKAIAVETEAVSKADEQTKDELTKALEKYKAAK